MKIVNEGDTIGTCKCDGCGEDVAVKVNKNLCVYYYCTKLTGVIKVNKKSVAQEERCFTRMSYGRTASIKIIEQYLEKENNNVKNQSGQPVEIVIEPAAPATPDGKLREVVTSAGNEQPASKLGGILEGVKHFITG